MICSPGSRTPASADATSARSELDARRIQAAASSQQRERHLRRLTREPGLAAFLTGKLIACKSRLGSERGAGGTWCWPWIRRCAARDARANPIEAARGRAEELPPALKGATDSQQSAGLRARVALEVLDVGVGNLLVFDVLVADLGSVARGELRRSGRAEAHPALACRAPARHLRAPEAAQPVVRLGWWRRRGCGVEAVTGAGGAPRHNRRRNRTKRSTKWPRSSIS